MQLHLPQFISPDMNNAFISTVGTLFKTNAKIRIAISPVEVTLT